MAFLTDNSEAISKTAENIRVSVEGNLLNSFFSLDKFNEGKDSLKKAFVEFVEFSKIEQEKFIKSLRNILSWKAVECVELPNKNFGILDSSLQRFSRGWRRASEKLQTV